MSKRLIVHTSRECCDSANTAVHADIKFSRESQTMEPDQDLEQLSAKDTKRQQEIVGMALWYAKTVN